MNQQKIGSGHVSGDLAECALKLTLVKVEKGEKTQISRKR
jgi:hypothetical protein